MLLLSLKHIGSNAGLGILLAYPSLRVSPWLLPLAHTVSRVPVWESIAAAGVAKFTATVATGGGYLGKPFRLYAR